MGNLANRTARHSNIIKKSCQPTENTFYKKLMSAIFLFAVFKLHLRNQCGDLF